jgi:hypothetical protein
MAVKTTAAFIAGLSAGWVLRSALGSSREVMVGGIVAAYGARDAVRRVVAERVEWLADLFAEGRARYQHQGEPAPVDTDEAPHVDVAGPRAA